MNCLTVFQVSDLIQIKAKSYPMIRFIKEECCETLDSNYLPFYLERNTLKFTDCNQYLFFNF